MIGPQSFKSSNLNHSFESVKTRKYSGKRLPANQRSIKKVQKYASKQGFEEGQTTSPDMLASDGHVNQEDSEHLANSPIPKQAKRETYRLASFKSFTPKISPFQLAMAGFYYLGPGDEIRCYSCGTTVSSLEGNEDMSSAMWHTPDCKHLNSESSSNVALESSSDTASASSTPVSASLSKSISQTVHKQASHQHLAPSHVVDPPFTVLDPSTTISAVYNQTHKSLLNVLSLNKEEDRRLTFTDDWPRNLTGLIDSLAKTGFFFLGNLDRTQCFSCGAVQKNWMPTDDVLAVHAEHFQYCRMVQNMEDRNIPFSPSTPENKHLVTKHSSLDLLHSPVSNRDVTHGLFHPASTSVKQSLPAYQLTASIKVPKDTPSTSKMIKLNFGTMERNDVELADPRLSSVMMHNRSYSTPETFSSPFEVSTVSHPLTPSVQEASTTAAFFSSTNLPQSVQPHFEFSSNLDQQLLNPLSAQFSQHPAFVSSRSSTPQRPLPSANCENLIAELDPFSAVNQPTQQVPPILPSSELDVDDYVDASEKQILQVTYPCLQPDKPSLVYLSMRLATFRLPYPENSSLSTITEVAIAGFYYLDSVDFVRCWYCGVEARNWATKWHAWEMHARLFPSCQFLLRNRGPSYAESIFSSSSDPEVPVEMEYPGYEGSSRHSSMSQFSMASLSGHIQSGPDRLPTPPIVDPREEAEDNRLELQRSMNSDFVRDAMGMGFQRNFIRKIIKKQIRDFSCSFQTLQGLVDVLLANEQDLIDLDSSDEEVSGSHSRALSLEDLDEDVELYHAEEETSTPVPSEVRAQEEVSSSNEVEYFSQGEFSIHDNEPSHEPAIAQSSQPQNVRLELQKLRDEKRCKVCLDRDSNMVFVPCGHMCACMDCTRMLRQCPICRKKINKAYKTYAS